MKKKTAKSSLKNFGTLIFFHNFFLPKLLLQNASLDHNLTFWRGCEKPGEIYVIDNNNNNNYNNLHPCSTEEQKKSRTFNQSLWTDGHLRWALQNSLLYTSLSIRVRIVRKSQDNPHLGHDKINFFYYPAMQICFVH